jgi:hypothetical protein
LDQGGDFRLALSHLFGGLQVLPAAMRDDIERRLREYHSIVLK